jgi:hypothetical protein
MSCQRKLWIDVIVFCRALKGGELATVDLRFAGRCFERKHLYPKYDAADVWRADQCLQGGRRQIGAVSG